MPYLLDEELVLEILNNISWSINIIFQRSAEIIVYEDFLKNDNGLEKLDSICMQFINIGEALKKIDKLTNSELLIKYTDIDWKAAKGIRDIITHHYFDIDAEIIFLTIQENLPQLQNRIKQIINDIS